MEEIGLFLSRINKKTGFFGAHHFCNTPGNIWNHEYLGSTSLTGSDLELCFSLPAFPGPQNTQRGPGRLGCHGFPPVDPEAPGPREGLLRHRDADGGALQGRPSLITGIRLIGPFPDSSGALRFLARDIRDSSSNPLLFTKYTPT